MYKNVDKYQLVEFKNEVLDSGHKRIECVPTKWIEFSSDPRKVVCKFMPLSWLCGLGYKEILQIMIKTQDDPSENWNSYAVNIRGSAASYEEAMQRLKILQSITTEEFVCTTESDKPPPKIALTTKSVAENVTKQQKEIAEIVKMQNKISILHSSEKPLEKETTYYSLELCGKKTVDTSRSCSSHQNPFVNKTQKAQKAYELLKLSEEYKRELEPSCSSQNIRQNTESVLAMRTDQRTPPFDEKYKLTLPFDTYEKFNEFDTSIRENAEQQAAFMQIVLFQFKNNKSLYENFVAILKKFITKDVALLFTVQREVHGKYVFKNTCFCNYLQATIYKVSDILINRVSSKEFFWNLDIAFDTRYW